MEGSLNKMSPLKARTLYFLEINYCVYFGCFGENVTFDRDPLDEMAVDFILFGILTTFKYNT